MLFASNSARCARSDKACAWMPSALSRSKAIFTPIEIRHGLAKANGMPYVETALHRVKARLKSAHGSGNCKLALSRLETKDHAAEGAGNFEFVRIPTNGLGTAKKQIAIWLQYTGDAIEDVGLEVVGKINHDVAAEDHVKAAEAGERIHKIELAERHLLFDLRLHRGLVAEGIEETVASIRGETAAQGEAFIYAFFRRLLYRGRNISGEDLHIAERMPRILTPVFLADHADRIGFLTCGAGRGPDAYRGYLVAHELRQDHALQRLERILIAKPQGLMGGHRVDNALPQAHIIVALQEIEQFAHRFEVELHQQAA